MYAYLQALQGQYREIIVIEMEQLITTLVFIHTVFLCVYMSAPGDTYNYWHDMDSI